VPVGWRAPDRACRGSAAVLGRVRAARPAACGPTARRAGRPLPGSECL